jgi:hypothetical protein
LEKQISIILRFSFRQSAMSGVFRSVPQVAVWGASFSLAAVTTDIVFP